MFGVNIQYAICNSKYWLTVFPDASEIKRKKTVPEISLDVYQEEFNEKSLWWF